MVGISRVSTFEMT